MTKPINPQKRQAIESALKATGIRRGMCIRSAAMRSSTPAADETGGLDWILSTELPATVFDWDEYDFVSEVLLANGMMVPASGQVPLLDSHNRQSALDVLGHVRDFSEVTVGTYPGRSGRVHFAADQHRLLGTAVAASVRTMFAGS